MITEAAIDNRYNVLLDVVGDSKPGKFKRKLEPFSEDGYTVDVNYASAPVSVALERNEIRAKRTKRLVPPDEVKMAHREAAKRFTEINSQPWVHVRVYDTSGQFGDQAPGKAAWLVYDKPPGEKGTIIDPEGFQKWLDKQDGY
jgi:hypothetical protein